MRFVDVRSLRNLCGRLWFWGGENEKTVPYNGYIRIAGKGKEDRRTGT